jgi:hypothetical protein
LKNSRYERTTDNHDFENARRSRGGRYKKLKDNIDDEKKRKENRRMMMSETALSQGQV